MKKLNFFEVKIGLIWSQNILDFSLYWIFFIKLSNQGKDHISGGQ